MISTVVLAGACALNTEGGLATTERSDAGVAGAAGAGIGGGVQGGSKQDASAGGSAGQGAHAGASGSSGAAGSSGTNAGEAGEAGSGGSCEGTYKPCGGQCVPIGDPSTGCLDGVCAPCGFEHATADCSNAGDCGIGSCDDGYDDCDSQRGNGCETAILSDSTNCGACGVSCTSAANGTPWCQQGVCQFDCNQGFDDCNGGEADGCEAALQSDSANCGGCGVVCEGGGSCEQGVCKLNCDATHADCDGQAANGCEADIANDPNNCGACSHTCHGGFNCRSGNCGCGADHANCDVGAPSGSFACEQLSGADKCKCSGSLCEYGQVCNGQGACSD